MFSVSLSIGDLTTEYAYHRTDLRFAPTRNALIKYHPRLFSLTAPDQRMLRRAMTAASPIFDLETSKLMMSFKENSESEGHLTHVRNSRRMIKALVTFAVKDQANCTLRIDGLGLLEPLKALMKKERIARVLLCDGFLKPTLERITPLKMDENFHKLDVLREDFTQGLFGRIIAIFDTPNLSAKEHLNRLTLLLEEVAQGKMPENTKISGTSQVSISSWVLSQLPIYINRFVDAQFNRYHGIKFVERIVELIRTKDPTKEAEFLQDLETRFNITKVEVFRYLAARGPSSIQLQVRYLEHLAKKSRFVYFSDTMAEVMSTREVNMTVHQVQKKAFPGGGKVTFVGLPLPIVFREYRDVMLRFFDIIEEEEWTWKKDVLEAANIKVSGLPGMMVCQIPTKTYKVKTFKLQSKLAPPPPRPAAAAAAAT